MEVKAIAKTKAEIQREYSKRTGYAAQAKYNAKTRKRIPFDVNLNTDADIIAKLDSVPSKAGYIKALIREDIRKNK